MDLNLKDKVILVTGGDGIKGSIGQTLVFALAKEGAIPVIVGRNDRGDRLRERASENGHRWYVYQNRCYPNRSNTDGCH